MERQIGEHFDFSGVTLEVVESGKCNGCYFFMDGDYTNCNCHKDETVGDCGSYLRSDHTSVIFKKYGI